MKVIILQYVVIIITIGIWGTADVDIFIATLLLNTSIYVYSTN